MPESMDDRPSLSYRTLCEAPSA